MVEKQQHSASKMNKVKKTENTKTTSTTSTTSTSGQKLAVILVRGLARVKKDIKDTLIMMQLTKRNRCVIIENNPLNKGMLQKAKDYITWGEISDETFGQLVAQRGVELESPLMDRKELYTYKHLDVDGKKYKKYFSLNPPRKGFGRKGVKMPFNLGGGLGYRGEKINDLIARMI